MITSSLFIMGIIFFALSLAILLAIGVYMFILEIRSVFFDRDLFGAAFLSILCSMLLGLLFLASHSILTDINL